MKDKCKDCVEWGTEFCGPCNELDEGVNDPAIFKAVFLAGGPGSGKSFIVGRTALTALGFKVVNSDAAFERALKKANIEATPENIYSPRGQQIRTGAKILTGKMMMNYLNGRLGLVIDGTGKDYAKIEKQANNLRELGYEVAMIFVNTDLDTALERNNKRARSLPDDEVKKMWNDVQKNLGKFQNFFRQQMFIVDNSTGSNYEGAIQSTYKKIMAWANKKPQSAAANKWIKSQTVKESVGEDTTTASVAFPPTMMPKKLLRRRKEPRIQEIIMVDRRYKEETRGAPVLRKRFRKYIEGPS